MRVARFSVVVLWSVAGLAAIAPDAALAGNVTFAIDYSGDGANEGFNDPTYGTQRRNAMAFAANIWGSLLTNTYSGETVTIHAVFDPLGGTTNSATLGSAGGATAHANFASGTGTNGKYLSSTVYVAALANNLKVWYLKASPPEINATLNSDVEGPTFWG